MDRVGSIPEFTYGPTKEFCRSSLYFQTLQACWEEAYYNKQKKLMVHYLLLQSRGQVSPHVTMEHMSDWLVSQGKKSFHLHCHSLSPAALQEVVWKETLEEGNELARLTWEVNTCLKMIDMEHKAVCKLRRSMHTTSPAGADIDPKVHIIVERAVRSILDKLSNKPCSNLLSPSQVVVELVPRILLALWLQPEEGHSDHPILLSGMAVSMVVAVGEKLSNTLKASSPHTPFSRAAAFDSVRSILGRISQSFSLDDLKTPFFMSSVCAFVADEVKSYFQPTADTLRVPPVLVVAFSATLPADIQADADQASSHLEVVEIPHNTEADPASSHPEVVDITPNTEKDPASAHLEVVDVTPEEKPLIVAVSATLPSDIQAEDVAVVTLDVTPHVTKDVTLDVPCRARKGAVQRFFLQALEGSVLCCALATRKRRNNINYSLDQKQD
ncbi:hypothetical protein J4Q44_G00286140 [Coregonus suidteri]|uniref:Uncharacterized protein n=1 Tax=Coregonus suidteri TaxID=861788 RepID=A0AAN8QIX8_9TELE